MTWSFFTFQFKCGLYRIIYVSVYTALAAEVYVLVLCFLT